MHLFGRISTDIQYYILYFIKILRIIEVFSENQAFSSIYEIVRIIESFLYLVILLSRK